MQLTDAQYPNGALPVDGYGTGFFRINGKLHEGGIVVSSAQGVVSWGGLADRAPVLALGGHVDVLFLGMGADIAMPPRDLLSALDEKGVMAEAMSSPSAARSYNVLLSEGRRVACALIPV
ncbi:Mth938-like domain-containing protein [Paracoccus aerodenitrificans]|uniref:Mth938-like domain-containing protein n=1 Tax=Paracoccus aerodenitrificans TaxID=3017781 RepID=UPI0022EFFF2E|nr:Mth938-like domain-containing protein [Paracoccus aerodenitrificans]WBU63166.1 Mth938-like domain-containing protein [Paracoccus aerodenitrificans]